MAWASWSRMLMIMTSSILVPLLRGASSRSWATCSARVMLVEVQPRAANSPIDRPKSGGPNPLGAARSPHFSSAAKGAGGCPSPSPPPGLCELTRPGHRVDVDAQVLTVREDAGGLLCRGEDRIHAGNLAVVADGHAEDPGRGVPGHHGQLVEAAAALTLRPDRAMARVVQVDHAGQLLSGR